MCVNVVSPKSFPNVALWIRLSMTDYPLNVICEDFVFICFTMSIKLNSAMKHGQIALHGIVTELTCTCLVYVLR